MINRVRALELSRETICLASCFGFGQLKDNYLDIWQPPLALSPDQIQAALLHSEPALSIRYCARDITPTISARPISSQYFMLYCYHEVRWRNIHQQPPKDIALSMFKQIICCIISTFKCILHALKNCHFAWFCIEGKTLKLVFSELMIVASVEVNQLWQTKVYKSIKGEEKS